MALILSKFDGKSLSSRASPNGGSCAQRSASPTTVTAPWLISLRSGSLDRFHAIGSSKKICSRGGFPQSVSGWHSVCRTTAYHDEIGRNKFLRPAYRSESTQRRPGPKTPHFGLEHIGLRVDNLDAAAAELKSKGAHFAMEPVTFTPGTKIAFVQAPQGVLVELIQRDR